MYSVLASFPDSLPLSMHITTELSDTHGNLIRVCVYVCVCRESEPGNKATLVIHLLLKHAQ